MRVAVKGGDPVHGAVKAHDHVNHEVKANAHGTADYRTRCN